MIAITVDDERPMLNALTDIVKSSPDIKEVHDFSACSAALQWISPSHAYLYQEMLHLHCFG